MLGLLVGCSYFSPGLGLWTGWDEILMREKHEFTFNERIEHIVFSYHFPYCKSGP